MPTDRCNRGSAAQSHASHAVRRRPITKSSERLTRARAARSSCGTVVPGGTESSSSDITPKRSGAEHRVDRLITLHSSLTSTWPGVPIRIAGGGSVTTIGVVVHTGKRLGGGTGALRSALADAGVTEPCWCEIPKSKKAPKQVREASRRRCRSPAGVGRRRHRPALHRHDRRRERQDRGGDPAGGHGESAGQSRRGSGGSREGRRHRRQWGPPTNRHRRHQWQGVRRDGRDGL